MVVFPNAKINLGLSVVEKRADGYHNIETVFYPVKLCDALDVAESDKFEFTLSGIGIEGDPRQNLVVKAYHLLKKEFRLPPVKIHLHKIIPIGAGLGGGSSDGAFMLRLLNSLFGLGLESKELIKYAGQLGADCPFFIVNSPSFATGTGNILSPAAIDLSEYSVVLLKPPFGVNTSEAYKELKPPFEKANRLFELVGLPISQWKGKIVNDLEKPVLKSYPEIKQIIETFYRNGAIFALMSGSGSAVYGIFKNPPEISRFNFPDNYSVFL